MVHRRLLVRSVLAVLMLSMTLAAGCAGGGGGKDGAVRTAEPIRIGAVLSLSGTYAALGDAEKKAIELELERVNAAGGVNGRPVEVVFEDDATDEAKSVAATTKLIERDEVVAILGASGTGQTMAARGEIDKAGIAQVSMAGGTAITGRFDPLVFQTPWPNTLVVPFVLDAMSEAGIKKAALISDSGGYGKDGRTVILAEGEKAGIELVADETFNPGDADMTPQLTKIKGSGAQAILMWTAGKEAAIICKNREQLKLELPVYGGSGIARREFITGAGSAAEGVLFGTGKCLVPSTYGEDSESYRVITDFATRYEAAYGEQPDIFAGHAYDAFNITIEAARRLGPEFTAAELRDEIEKTSGFVGFGGTFAFSSTDHNGLTSEDLVMYEIEDGKWTVAGE